MLEGRRPGALPRGWWLIAFALLYVVPYYPKIHSANELPRAYLVKAMVDHGRLSIDESVARWGSTVDVSPWQGRSYSNKAPGTSLLTAPVYAAVELALGEEPSLGLTVWLGRLVTGILPSLLLLALLPGLLARHGVGPPVQRLVVVIYALGSMAMPYSILFIAHQPSAVAVVLAWILAQRVADEGTGMASGSGSGTASGSASGSGSGSASGSGSGTASGSGSGTASGTASASASASASGLPQAVWRNPLPLPHSSRRALIFMALAGWSAGWAPLLDYQAAFALPPLALFLGWQLWRRADRWPLFAAALAGAALPIAALLGYHALAFGSPWRTGYDASVTFAVYHQQGFLGITALRWRAFASSMVGLDNGLLVFAPWLLLALPGLVLLWRRGRRGEVVTLGGIAALYLLFLSSITFWRGGWQLGPRYIVVMLPFLLPPVAVALEAALRRIAGQVLAMAACFVGVIVYAASCAQFPHFPERFRNPVHEVTLRLWAEGLAAPNPLAWAGVPGAWSLLPYVAAVVLATGLAARGVARGWRPVFAALALAVLLLAAMGLAPRSGPGGQEAFEWVRSAMTPSP